MLNHQRVLAMKRPFSHSDTVSSAGSLKYRHEHVVVVVIIISITNTTSIVMFESIVAAISS